MCATRLTHHSWPRSIASPDSFAVAPRSTVQPMQQLRFGHLTSADPAAELQTFLLQVMPIQEHGFIRECGEGVGKEAADPARSIGNQQEGAERSQTQAHGDVQALEEGCAHTTQVAVASCRRDPRGAEFEKVTDFRSAREYFVDGQEHLLWLQGRPQTTQVLDRTACLCTPGGKHALPVGPRHALWWTDLVTRQCRVADCGQFCWPPSPAPHLPVGHKLQVQGCEVMVCG